MEARDVHEGQEAREAHEDRDAHEGQEVQEAREVHGGQKAHKIRREVREDGYAGVAVEDEMDPVEHDDAVVVVVEEQNDRAEAVSGGGSEVAVALAVLAVDLVAPEAQEEHEIGDGGDSWFPIERRFTWWDYEDGERSVWLRNK